MAEENTKKRKRNGHRPHATAPQKDAEISGDPSLFAVRKALPIWESRHQIRQSLIDNDVLVLVGETGSGKSTQVPQFLCDEPWCTGLVAITQPRRVAATTLAYRVAREMGTPLGHTSTKSANTNSKGFSVTGRVGYSVRFDYQMPRGVKVKFLTEGMLLQEMLHDPALLKYSCVVVDEVHERSLDVDLLLGFLRQIQLGDSPGGQKRKGKPLKIVVMSATADVDKICDFFRPDEKETAEQTGEEKNADDEKGAEDGTEKAGEKDEKSRKKGKKNKKGQPETPSANLALSLLASLPAAKPSPLPPSPSPASQVSRLRIPGRQFPVTIIHVPRPVPVIVDALVKTVFQINMEEPHPGDILAFLAGQDEIEAAKRLIEERIPTLPVTVPRIEVCPLFGQLSMEAQYKAFQPSSQRFTRKVVLATNIAETSVTVPGVRYVIDNGKAKSKVFMSSLKMETLLSRPISKSSAIQRAGRAGREAPGKCYRLYTEESFDKLDAVELPELLRIDILGAVLSMKAHNIDNPFMFPMMDKPDFDAMERALIQLYRLGGMENARAISQDGRVMSMLPLSAPYGRVLLEAAATGSGARTAVDAPADDDQNGGAHFSDFESGCLSETIDIIACLTAGDDIFLSLQKVSDQRAEIEELRQELQRREGDLLTYLTTMQRFVAEKSSRWKEWCTARGINLRVMRQAVNVRRQLRRMCVQHKLVASAEDLGEDSIGSQNIAPPASPHKAETLIKCFMRGFALMTAMRSPEGSYVTSEGKQVVSIHPSSVLHGRKVEAIMFLEQVYTQKNYARKVSVIKSDWILDEVRRRNEVYPLH